MYVLKKSILAIFIVGSIGVADAAPKKDIVTLSYINAFTEDCVNLLMKDPKIVNGDFYNLSKNTFEWPSEGFSKYVDYSPSGAYFPKMSEFWRKNQVEIVNKVAVSLAERISTFTPRAKGEFEKTSDYDISIMRDKDAYLKKFGNTKASFQLYGLVWNTLVGRPQVDTRFNSKNSMKPVYNADKEVLTVNIKPSNTPIGDEFAQNPVPTLPFKHDFSIKYDIPLSLQDAKKLSSFQYGRGASSLYPTVTFYLDGDNIVVKNISLEPFDEDAVKEYKALGLNPIQAAVNVKTNYFFGTKGNAIFESSLKK